MKNVFLLFVLVVPLVFIRCAKLPAGQQKIDPVLLSQLKQKPSSTDKIYSCIVYTKNPDALRKAGVHLNSVLPTFATAQLTRSQIFKLAEMPQVTYIESPKPDRTQTDGASGKPS